LAVDSDTLIVVILNSATSLFAGFAIFSILGHMAHTLSTTVDKVAASGVSVLSPVNYHLSIKQRRLWMQYRTKMQRTIRCI